MKKAFTLIELLVVIAIIGILAALVIANMSAARARARDARRKADLDTLRNAIEMFMDTNPNPPGTVDTTYQSDSANWTTLQTVLATPGYLTTLPRDPQNGTAVSGVIRKIYRYRYHYDAISGLYQYELDAFLENDTAAMQNDNGNANTTPSWRYEVGTILTLMSTL